MTAPQCDKTNALGSWLLRAITAGLALSGGAAGAAGGARHTTGDGFEHVTPRRLLQTGGAAGVLENVKAVMPADALVMPGQRHALRPEAPKVALTFLSMGQFSQEQTWQHWFAAAEGQVALAPLQQGSCLQDLVRSAVAPGPPGPASDNAIARQQLFSVYVHVPPDVSYPADSLFAPYVVNKRHATAWGTHTISEAMRSLLAEGLKDEDNRVFVTLSDDAVPLYPPTVLYQSALNFPKSRINACLGGDRTLSRWHEDMAIAKVPVTPDDWRKSSQWFQIKRTHAAHLMRDGGISATFRDHCSGDATHPPCASDEHYPATALAMLGHAGETDCQGTIMYTDWRDGGSHPYTFEDDDIRPFLMERMAAGEDCHALLADQVAAFGFVRRGTGLEQAKGACENALAWSDHLLGSSCRLFARKFGATAEPHVARWMKHMLQASAERSDEASLNFVRTDLASNVSRIDEQLRAHHFPEAGCASSRRDYIWPRGVFVEFACPSESIGTHATLIEALRCYAEIPVCEPVLAHKRLFTAVDWAFADTLEGGAAMNDGIAVLRALRESAKPARHATVAAGVMAAVRAAEISVPYYVDEFEIITPDNQVALLAAVWFESEARPGERDERYAQHAGMMGRMLRNPAALGIAVEGVLHQRVPLLHLTDVDTKDFTAVAQFAEWVVDAIAPVTQEAINAVLGARPPGKGMSGHPIGKLADALGRRLRGAERLYPDIAWITARPNGRSMLAAIMATLFLGYDTAEAAQRWSALDMASDVMQSGVAHRRVAEDLRILVSLARALARPALMQYQVEPL